MEDKLKQIIGEIKPLDEQAMQEARARQDELTKPRGSMGMLEEVSVQIAGIKGEVRPSIDNKAIFTLAGDHGITAEGVSAYPAEVTPQMVFNFLSGGAAINVLAKRAGARVIVADLGVNFDFDPEFSPVDRKIAKGTDNMAQGPAMTRDQAIASVMAGIELVDSEMENGLDIIGTGEMGIGNTTPASAITAAICGGPVKDLTGRGAGLDDDGLSAKIHIIEKVLEVNKPDPADGLDVLSKLGGFEIGGIAGLIIGAAKNRLPVLIDGFISGAGALIAYTLAPQTKDFMIAAHQSVEIGHKKILDYMGLKALLNLNLKLGEGTGGAIGLYLVQCAVAILDEMATFAEAGVSDKE